MLVVLPPPLGRKLLLCSREYRLSEPFPSQFASYCQPRGCEQHLLPHIRRIGHVGNGHVSIRGLLMPPQDDVRRFILFEEGFERGQVVEEVGG